MQILLFILFVGGLVFLLGELPVVTGRGINQVREALANIEAIELSGKTLFISDLHLTANPALEEQFNLDFSTVQNVVIVGDFLDSQEDFESFGPPAGGEEKRFRTILQEIVPRNFSGNIFFVHARTHDPQNLELAQISFDGFEFFHVGEYGKFNVNGVSIVTYHGQQLHTGMIGGGIGWLAEKIGKPLPLERLGKKRFGIDEHTWVINGHSHVPGIDKEAKVANTGSFVGAPFNKFIFRIHIGTGVLFEDNRVELQEYEGLNLKSLYPFSL